MGRLIAPFLLEMIIKGVGSNEIEKNDFISKISMKHRTPLRKRLLCFLLTGIIVGITPLSVSAETLEEIQAYQDQLQSENQELQTKLNSLRQDEAQKQEYQDTL